MTNPRLLLRLLLVISLATPLAPAQFVTAPLTVLTVGPGKQYTSIQPALTAAAGLNQPNQYTPVLIEVSSGTYSGPLTLDVPYVDGVLILEIAAKGKVVLTAPGDTVLTKSGLFCILALTKLRFEGAGNGVAMASDIDLRVDRCRFRAIDENAVYVDSSDSDVGGWGSPSNVEISKSRFDDCGSGLVFDGHFEGPYTWAGGKVERCKFTGMSDTAIRVSALQYTVERNAIKSSPTGIAFYGSLCFLFKNTVRGSIERAIDVTKAPGELGSTLYVYDNKLLKGAGTGLWIDATMSSGFQSSGNRIIKMGQVGVHVLGPEMTFGFTEFAGRIINDTIVAPGFAGVLLQAGDCQVLDTRVSKAGSYGFRVQVGNNTFEGCRASKTSAIGFGLSDTTAGANTYLDGNDFGSVDSTLPNPF